MITLEKMKSKSNFSRNTVVILDQASGYLQIDMLEAYAARFKNRVIIAGTIVERGTPLSDQVLWHRIPKYNRSTTFKRIYTWILGTLSMLWIVWRYYRKAHIVAITNPPFSVFLPWILGCKSYDVVVYDMYPDALVHYGYLNNDNFFFKWWSKLNKNAFAKARKVFTLTEGMGKLVENYTTKKANIVPLWSSATDFRLVPRAENKILEKTGTLHTFNIVYSGNLGITHPIEKLIVLAKFLDASQFSVIIIGEGAKKKLLEKKIKESKVQNVYLLPWQPIELLTHNLYAGDLNVVTLDKEAGNLSIPSKTFNILSIGHPILGICDKNSDLAKLIEDNNCGFVSDGKDIKALASEIIKLKKDTTRLKKIKENSLKTSSLFTKKNATLYL